MTRAKFRTRLRIVSILLAIILCVFIARLYVVQVMYGDEFRARAERQYVSALAAPFDRGSIFFTRKDGEHISAATLTTGFTLAINPTQIEDPEGVYAAVNAIVPIERDDFLARAHKQDPYEEIVQQVPEEVGQQISELELDGVMLVRDRWRYYPGNELAAHTVGFLAYKDNTLAGRYGIERQYEEVLSRESSSLYVNFFAEVFANIGNIIFDRSATREGHVVTTLEPIVQSRLEVELAEVHEKWGSAETAGIIIHPKTGAIYALGVRPSFDANNFGEGNTALFKNPVVENIYEFGSVIKPLTIAAGIDAGAVTRETTYNDKGSIRVDGATVSNFDGEARGVVSMQEVLSQSLNTGVAFVVEEMGTDAFREYFEKLNVGGETGIDLPNEAKGLVGNLESPRTLEYITASFGQGIAMSPINAAAMLATLANDGKLVTPHVVSEIRHPSGLITKIEHEEGVQVFDPESTKEVTRMLVTVVDEALGGGNVEIKTMSVAAKTGTAQIASPEGGYYDDRYLHSFFGYFPAYDPEFLIFLYTVEPKEVRYASQTLTDPFLNMVKFLINYYTIEPDRVYEESI